MGRGLRLLINGPAGLRAVRGVVSRIGSAGGRWQGRATWKVRVVPRLSLLKHRRNSRVFQDLTTPDQDVSIWLRSDSQITYHASIGRDDGSVADIPPGKWQVVMHHGSAYAVYIVGAIREFAARSAITTLANGGRFTVGRLPVTGGDIMPVTPLISHAALYWHLRYVLEADEDVDEVTDWRDLRARERTTILSMRGARDL